MTFLKQLSLTIILLLSLPLFVLGQTEVKGRIHDQGKGLAGANIRVKGSNLGTVSDVNGEFSLKVPDKKEYTLVVSFVGYEEKEIRMDILRSAPEKLSIRLYPAIYPGEEVVITATRSRENIYEIPGSIRVIDKKEIQRIPAQKVDEIIQYASGVNAFRSGGIYSMRPVVTLRGLSGDEQGRTLVLLDGVPINKGDTGGVNWNRLDKNNIERIEIYRGPGSGLYGNHAMGGVINIITRKPEDDLSGNAGMSFGTYNTQKGNLYLGSRMSKKVWASASGFFTNSDGYNPIPDSFRSDPDYSIPRYLNEKGISLKSGLDQSKALKLEMQYDYFQDRRGEGEKIKAPYGEYRHFNTHFARASAEGETALLNYRANVFYQKEHYFRLDERMRGGNYSRFNVNSNRIDQGGMLHLSKQVCPRQNLSIGFDTRLGSVDGGDYYQTSPDSVVNSGKMNLTAIYLQDAVNLADGRLKIIAGIRYDRARFYDGNYQSTDNAWAGILPELTSHTWEAWSPRLSVNLKTGKKSKIYASWARGFRASILDDLTRSGWMWVGPKIANPNLEPEKLDNYEIGTDLALNESIRLSASAFYSRGYDFLYYVRTGDSLFGSRPVYQRQNVTGVSILGGELESQIRINESISFVGSYTYNHSEILSFTENPELEGKVLKYTPVHHAKATVFWTNKFMDINLIALYKSKQFIDDKNTASIDPYFTADIKLSKKIAENFNAWLSVNNVFNAQHMDNELYLSPGRLVNLGIDVRF